MRAHPRPAADELAAQPWLAALTQVMVRVTANADREGVLEALAAGVVDAFGAALARLWLFDPAEAALVLNAGAGVTDDLLGGRERLPLSDPTPLVVQAFLRREPVVVDPLTPTTWPHRFAIVAQHGLRAYVAFPLLVGDRAVGAMAVALRRAVPPLLLEALAVLAHQAALALDHVRVLAETQALQAVAASLASERDSQALLKRLVAQTATALGADGCAVWLLDDTDFLVPAAHFGFSDALYQQLVALLRLPRPQVQGRGEWRTSYERLRDTRAPYFTLDERQRAVEDGDTLAAAYADAGIVSAGRLPLFAPGGAVMGMLALYHRHERAYAESEVRLAQAFADQIAVAIENARLYAESQEAVRQAQSLARIAASVALGGPLETVLDALAGRVVAASGAVACAVSLAEGDPPQLRIAGSAGLPDGYAAAYNQIERGQTPSNNRAVFQDRRPRVRRNVWPELLRRPQYQPLHPFAQQVAWQAMALTPLVTRDHAVGTLTTYYRAGEEPNDREIAFLGAIADQAAIAVANARLYDQAQEETRKTAALAQIAASLTVDQSMEETLNALAAGAMRATRAAAAAVLLTDPVTARTQYAGAAGFPEGLAARLTALPAEATGLGNREQILSQREPEIVTNLRQTVLADPRYAPLHAYVDQVDWETSVGMPMVFHGRVLGFVNAYYGPEAAPSMEQIALLRPIADQAAVAVENARLFLEVRDKASLEERTRLAHDLHDSVTQTVFSLGMLARAAQTQQARGSAQLGGTLDRVATLAQEALIEMRALLFELRPASLADEGLVTALAKLVDVVRTRTGLAIDYSASGKVRLAPEQELAVFRIVQEALGNAAKHARASATTVAFTAEAAGVVVTVRDDGIGFDSATPVVASADGARGGQGLRSMRERAAATGLLLEVESMPGQGTAISVTVPLK